MVAVSFHLTEEEYFDFNYYTSWAAPERRKYRLFYYGKVFLLYFLVAAVYILTNHTSQIAIDFIIFSIIGLVYFLLIPYLIRRSIRRRVKGMLAAKENEHILQESQLILDDTGIYDKDNVSESRYDWEAIVRKSETETTFYLYTNSYHAIVIPKRALKSTAELTSLRKLLDTNLPLSSEFGQ